MMSRTTASTSADTSRLVVRNAAKRCSKSASDWASVMAIVCSSPVYRARRGFPRAANIGKAGLDAFDIQHDRAAARKDQFDDARGLADLDKADRQQGENFGRLVAGDAAGLGAQHPVEMQHGLPSFIVLAKQ